MSTIGNIEKSQEITGNSTSDKHKSSLFFASIKAQSVLFFITAAYVIATFFLSRNTPGIQPYEFNVTFFLVMLPILFLSVIILRFFHICNHVKPEHPIQALYHDLKGFLSCPRRLSLGVPVIIALFFFIEAFAFIKTNIPAFRPFGWDVYFMELDRWMHFGIHPWEYLQPVFGYAPVTFLINVSYNTWFMVMWTVFIWQAFADHPSRLRLQFFISFLLVWSIGGSLLAVVFSSAGPAFYAALNLTPNPYEELMTYLYQVNEALPIWALNIQELLWASYTDKQGVVSGISAMPSMHNASAILFALLGWQVSRIHGIALTLFAIMIFLGSIHLGWHYAVDGYLAAIIAISAWWIAGKIAAWIDDQPAAKAYKALFDG